MFSWCKLLPLCTVTAAAAFFAAASIVSNAAVASASVAVADDAILVLVPALSLAT